MTTTGPATPRRSAELSALRRLSRNVLLVGTVLAVLAAFGPVWVVRAGVLVAVAAAVIACGVAWRELAEVRRQHAAATLAASKAHGSALREERRQNASVVDVLTVRVRDANAQVAGQQAHIVELTANIVGLTTTIASLRSEVSSLQSGHRRDQDEISRREADIAALKDVVRAREAELLALSEAGGQVRSIPRRMLTEHQPQAAEPSGELWLDDRRPQVVDLADVNVAMPNYEGERKLA